MGAEVICLDDRTLARTDKGRRGVWPITISGDGQAVAWRLCSDPIAPAIQEYWVVTNGLERPSAHFAGRPAMSRNGALTAWRFHSRDDEAYVHIEDRDKGPYEEATDPVVTPNGATVAYAYRRDKQWFLRVGDSETELTSRPLEVFVSADSRSFGWVQLVARPDHGVDMKVEAFGTSGEPFSLVSGPSISPTEPLVAYGAEVGGKKYVVLGTKKVETPDRVGDPVFSPDGRKVGYGARIGNELWWKVLDVASYR